MIEAMPVCTHVGFGNFLEFFDWIDCSLGPAGEAEKQGASSGNCIALYRRKTPSNFTKASFDYPPFSKNCSSEQPIYSPWQLSANNGELTCPKEPSPRTRGY